MTLVQVLKLSIPTVIYYAVAIAAMSYLGEIDPGGPCVPGLVVFVFPIVFLISIVMLIRNFYLAISGDKKHYIAAILHSLVLGFVLVMFIIN